MPVGACVLMSAPTGSFICLAHVGTKHTTMLRHLMLTKAFRLGTSIAQADAQSRASLADASMHGTVDCRSMQASTWLSDAPHAPQFVVSFLNPGLPGGTQPRELLSQQHGPSCS